MSNVPHVCVPRILTDEQRAKSVTLAIRENPDNRQEVKHTDGRTLAVEVNKRWKSGTVLHVRFLNGDQIQKMKCEREAHRWESYANIKFVFDDAPDAAIRVAFYDGGNFADQGSWSYIGPDCKLAPAHEQTLNLGWLTKDTPDGEWQRVVVHEFGHALGADHEDQQPAANIQWDTAAVYRYFMGPPNNWTKQMVDENVLDRSDPTGVAHTDFDPVSIMAYAIDPSFTLDKKGVIGGVTLSDRDKTLIGQMYPFDIPVTPVKPSQIIPGAPALNFTIGVGNSFVQVDFPVAVAGNYRIWSSFLGGIVSVFDPKGHKISSALQQVVFHATPGKYLVTVRPQHPGNNASFRIVARKVG